MNPRRFFREPLLHFALLGVIVFAVDAFLRDRAGEPRADAIVVSRARIENLSALFSKTWQRPPNAKELRGLVDDYVLEEALYREGLALGVDQDDTVIRRRVRQKMEFFVDDVVDVAEPSDAELEGWLEENADSYRRPSRFNFQQVYLNPERRGMALRSDVERVLATLRQAGGPSDPRELGDASLLEHAYLDAGSGRISSDFGAVFAERLAALPTGEWSGPVESAFGLHLVFVDAKTEGGLPPLAKVRDAVVRDWRYAQRERASRDFYAEVLERYRVTIEWPDERLALRTGAPVGMRR